MNAGARRDQARRLSEQVHVDALLNQWLRETHVDPRGGHLVLAELISSGRELHVEVRHRSLTGVHRFGSVRARYPDGPLPGGEQRTGDDPVGALELAELLGREAAVRAGGNPDWDGPAAARRLLAAVAESLHGLEDAVVEGTVPASAADPFDATAVGSPTPGAHTVLAPGPVTVHWVAAPAPDGEADPVFTELLGLPADPAGQGWMPRFEPPAPGVAVAADRPGRLLADGRTVELADGAALVLDRGADDLPVDPDAVALTVGALTITPTRALRQLPGGGRVRLLAGPGSAEPLAWVSVGALVAAHRDRGGPVRAVLRDPTGWYAGYLDHLLVPVLTGWAEHGLAVAPTPAQTLVTLDDAGYVDRIRCDDGHRCDDGDGGGDGDAAGAGDGRSDHPVADRLTHFLLREHLLVVLGLLADTAGVAEDKLVAVLDARLDEAGAHFRRSGHTTVCALLDDWRRAPTLPLRTVLHGGLLNPAHIFARPGPAAVYQLATNPLAPVAAQADLGPPPLPVLDGGWGLRPVLAGDTDTIAVVHRWMNTAHVAHGWRQAWTLAHWDTEIAEQHAGSWVRPYIVTFQGRDVAYLEVYRNSGHPMAQCYRMRPTDVGFHMAIGEPSGINRGVAGTLFPMIIRAVLAADPRCGRVVGEPNVRNGAMRRSMIKTGWPIVREIALAHKNAMLVIYERGAPLAGDQA